MSNLLHLLGKPRRDAAAGGGAPGGTLLNDLFNGSPVTIASHTPDTGGPWVSRFGDAQIDGSGNATAFGASIATVNVADADVTITTHFGENAPAGAVFRFTDASNYWYATYSPSAEQLRIFEVVAGSPTVRGSGIRTSTSADRTLTVVVSGNSVSATVDGGAAINFSPMATGAGITHHGLYVEDSAQMRDFMIQA